MLIERFYCAKLNSTERKSSRKRAALLPFSSKTIPPPARMMKRIIIPVLAGGGEGRGNLEITNQTLRAVQNPRFTHAHHLYH